LEHQTRCTTDVTSIAEAMDVAQTGFARLSWDLVGAEGERELKTQAMTVRCLQRADGSIPDSDTEAGLVCFVAKSY
jgi:prolyl-tRNA synthetase